VIVAEQAMRVAGEAAADDDDVIHGDGLRVWMRGWVGAG
jgi:hypothetical protein